MDIRYTWESMWQSSLLELKRRFCGQNVVDGKHKIFFLGAKAVDKTLVRKSDPVYVPIMQI